MIKQRRSFSAEFKREAADLVLKQNYSYIEASSQMARKVAANSCCWWRNSRFELNRVLESRAG